MIPEGFYTASPASWPPAVLKSGTGTPYMSVKVYLYRGPTFVGDGEIKLYLSDAAFDQTAARLDRMGFNGSFSQPALSGEPFEVEVRHEEYNGRQQVRIEVVSGQKTDADELARLDSRWRQQHAKPATAPATAPPQPAPPPPATAAPAAAPAPTPAPAAPVVDATPPRQWTREDAWAVFGNDAREWNRVIAEVSAATGTPYEQFTSEHWGKVADSVIPI